ncbi:GlsB/YeaQ/YmgE family stress response membrane protein [soil metagenome]
MQGLGWISFLIVGLIAGYAAQMLTGRSHTLLQNLLVGVVGAYLGAALFWIIGLQATGFVGALVIAPIGAIVLLFIVDRMRGRA